MRRHGPFAAAAITSTLLLAACGGSSGGSGGSSQKVSLQANLYGAFVAHQLAVIAEVADRVAVMNNGRIVEIGDTAIVFHAPQDDYTKALLAAHPHPDLEGRQARQV
jgi:ABC-type dipeptide/oligopeptide/nickel transport system ATPase component